jgi:hypothetical protein
MNRLKWLLPLVAFFPLLMAPSGGYPVNPTFQSVAVKGAVTVTLPPSTQANILAFSNTNGAGTIDVGPTGLVELGTSTATNLSFYTNNATRGQVTAAGGLIFPVTVTGGDCGSGCANFQSLKVNGVPSFAPIAATLASDSTKTSTTAQALDATLQFTLPAGTYLVEFNGAISQAGIAAGAGGFAACLQAAGSIPVLSAGSYSFALYVTNVAFSTQWFGQQTITSTCTGGSQVIFSSQTTGGTAFDQVVFRGMLTTTTSGVFGLSWAQSLSNATATTIKQGSTLIANRVL